VNSGIGEDKQITAAQRFLVGRQFFVIFVVFTIAQMTSFPYSPSDLWGLPSTFILVFCQVGVPAGVMWC
jgi:hypothetical protein